MSTIEKNQKKSTQAKTQIYICIYIKEREKERERECKEYTEITKPQAQKRKLHKY